MGELECEALWKLFGTGTEAGRLVRRMFAPTQQQIGQSIQYPKVVRQRLPAVPTISLKPVVPKVRYPKFRRRTASLSCLGRGQRRPFRVIQQEMGSLEEPPPPVTTKDLSAEKSKLQEVFQFSYSTLLPATVAPPRVKGFAATHTAPAMPEEHLMQELTKEIREAQDSLKALGERITASVDRRTLNALKYEELALRNEIERKLVDLNVAAACAT